VIILLFDSKVGHIPYTTFHLPLFFQAHAIKNSYGGICVYFLKGDKIDVLDADMQSAMLKSSRICKARGNLMVYPM